ncbi:DUF6792 domain-containing protein [Virgibacillus soli]|uniref:DUF6792 domain-containing protein n=1 Tax=Paracerasibacillus soli TaxID=480284 RepID=A0ABU5CSQ8_9BACI|nr:DUF6792 domain-containing protein [Virgibacillus soli]MDY0409410.1 DUF6792 domain-containing protein [Virgibacillus soli]
MTNQKDILYTDIIKIRIMDIEYDGITEDEIRRIYYEETGKELDVAVDIYYSEDYIEEVDANGFNGTIIHLFDEEQGINETYTITRGTEMTQENDWRPIDWIYNLMGIFVGENTEQYRAAEYFDQEVTNEIKLKTGGKVRKIGLGHSLGGNLITLLQIVLGYFDDVYTVNAAPPSITDTIIGKF